MALCFRGLAAVIHTDIYFAEFNRTRTQQLALQQSFAIIKVIITIKVKKVKRIVLPSNNQQIVEEFIAIQAMKEEFEQYDVPIAFQMSAAAASMCACSLEISIKKGRSARRWLN